MSVATCPTRQELEAYVSGTLSREAHEALDGHLDECSACQESVATLDDRAWTLLSRLRPLPPGQPTCDDPALRALVIRARSLGSRSHLSTQCQMPAAGASCTFSQFLERLARSGLLTAEEATAVAHDLPATDAEELAREMVNREKLTAYQAHELLHGTGEGLVLGSYVLLEPLGAGGMGQVFKAWHRHMRRTVALKVLAPDLLRSAPARVRFRREVEAAARLSSPHIVAAYDAGEDHGRDFLVMEYVAGRNLADLIKQEGPLPPRRALEYLLQAARGLEHAHAAGVVHRDVKPANLLVDAAGTVKVLDLGLARLQLAERSEPDSGLTSSSVVMGTAGFMAPEQATDTHNADVRADVYSLGCCLHHLLVGRPPYEGRTALEMLLAHREQPIPSLCAARPDCPPAVDVLFRRMVARRPQERCPDMAAVIREVEQLLAAAPRTARPRRGHVAVWGGLVLAGAILAAVVLSRGLFPLSRQPAPSPDREAEGPPVAAPPLDRPTPPPPPTERSLVAATLPERLAPPAPVIATQPERPVAPRTPVIDLVRIPAGEFWMGSADSDPAATAQEKPRHRVKILRSFFLGKTKVTQAQYQEVMGVNPSTFSSRGEFRRQVEGLDTSNHPVESLSWLDAVKFCNRLSQRQELRPYYQIEGAEVSIAGGDGYRLPTEAEWEYACRADTDSAWSFGDREADLDAHAWYAGNAGDRTHPVGLKKPNPWGLYDIHGNVPEWCWDRYDPTYYQRSKVSDPPGPGEGRTRVHRGGAWNDLAPQTRSAARDSLGITYRVLEVVGLRVARSEGHGQ